jgi:hypothetical protein
MREYLRRLLSLQIKKRDEHLEQVKHLQEFIEDLEALVNSLFEMPPDPQDSRDAFILDAYTRGQKLIAIRGKIQLNPAWTPLHTDSAVRHAMVRYCRRRGIDPPRRK